MADWVGAILSGGPPPHRSPASRAVLSLLWLGTLRLRLRLQPPDSPSLRSVLRSSRRGGRAATW
jgi:hypothetical protein